MRPRVLLACALCRLSRFALRLLGRGGTALPGKLALRVCPDLIGCLARGVDVLAVTGTNGKTTTVRMICHMLEGLSLPHFTNRSGANLASGLAAEFVAHATLTGRPKIPRAVLECDEAALRLVAGQLRPRAIVVTNVFRDQLDRYGEVTHTRALIRDGILEAPEAVLCLNADCSLTASLAGELPNQTLFFGLEEEACGETARDGDGESLSDAPRCLRCGGAHRYRYRAYAHLGGFFCPDCGSERPPADVAVLRITQADEDGSDADVCACGEAFPLRVGLPSLYNVCNAAAALCALCALKLPVRRAALSLESVKAGFGRMETLPLGDRQARVILVKNPAGCNRALDYLASLEGPYLPVFCLNDKIADGTDVSWIWDADYGRLVERRAFEQAVVFGTRAGDMRLRLKYEGMDDGDILRPGDLDGLMACLQNSPLPVYILPNYTAMLEVRGRIARDAGKDQFWK